jgi:hypothetical protein
MLEIAGQRARRARRRRWKVARRLASEGAFLVAMFDDRDRGSGGPHARRADGSPHAAPTRIGTYIALQR